MSGETLRKPRSSVRLPAPGDLPFDLRIANGKFHQVAVVGWWIAFVVSDESATWADRLWIASMYEKLRSGFGIRRRSGPRVSTENLIQKIFPAVSPRTGVKSVELTCGWLRKVGHA
ncbi:MAG: hypothetical protein C0478_00580 [Planctomyces sp.]|nr:hypothetical protein [Planctomyces sp.]